MPPRGEEARSGKSRRSPGAGGFRRTRAAFLLPGAGLLVLLALGRALIQGWGTVPAQVGRVTVSVRGEALVVRSERALFAELAGELRPAAKEGERVPRGAVVARVEPVYGGAAAAAAGEARWLRAPLAGTVSYVLDGLEGVLGPQNLPELLNSETPVADLAQGAEPQATRARQRVTPGQPVAKVVDNFQVWLVADFPSGVRAALPQAGERVQLRFLGTGTPAGAVCRATVTGRRDGRRGSRLVIVPVEYWPEFGRARRTAVELVLGEYEGVLVPRSSLVEQGGTVGVMVQSAAGRNFQPVSVRGGDRER
ncbi:MAG TPA: hypothetical protein GXX28_11415, partial [Firmicutes bacterium]|nr:hypothetical protein [Bacillota bacterium]